jgi:hypothetical protein
MTPVDRSTKLKLAVDMHLHQREIEIIRNLPFIRNQGEENDDQGDYPAFARPSTLKLGWSETYSDQGALI